jgi:anti-sigma B factor antagonist
VTDEFRLDVAVRGAERWVAVDGELDLATAPGLDVALDECLGHERVPRVVIDLTTCSFIDSTGVRSLVRFGESARGAGTDLSIVCLPGSAARFTLDLLGVGDTIPIHDSADALSLGGGPRGPR